MRLGGLYGRRRSRRTKSITISEHVRLGDKNKEKQFTVYLEFANYEKYPNLGQLAKRNLSARMCSVPSKRELKQAKRVVTGKWKKAPFLKEQLYNDWIRLLDWPRI